MLQSALLVGLGRGKYGKAPIHVLDPEETSCTLR